MRLQDGARLNLAKMIATKIATVATIRFQKLTSNRFFFLVRTPIRSKTTVISAMAITKCTTIGWMTSIGGFCR